MGWLERGMVWPWLLFFLFLLGHTRIDRPWRTSLPTWHTTGVLLVRPRVLLLHGLRSKVLTVSLCDLLGHRIRKESVGCERPTWVCERSWSWQQSLDPFGNFYSVR